MTKLLVFGNSGSGKSTLASKIAHSESIAHLDLDSIAWLQTSTPTRMPLEESSTHIQTFISENTSWVIEGCYADLIECVLPEASELIFLNLPVQACIENAKMRPWEPHKYPSKEAQDKNLDMLIDWIRQYESRSDTFSQSAHQALFDKFSGSKKMYTTNGAA